MRNRFTLNKVMHNDKLMMAISLIAAISIWIGVTYFNSTDQRTFSCPLEVDLRGSYADQLQLKVIGQSSFTIKVTVSGSRSVLTQLTEDDISLKPDLSAVQKSGNVDVPVEYVLNKSKGDFKIDWMEVGFVTVTCDYWNTVYMAVKPDVSQVTVTGENMTLGTAVVDPKALEYGKIAISGPSTDTSKIATVTAAVEPQTITELKVISATLKAFDVDGNPVELTNCTISGKTDKAIDVTVPVWEYRTVDFTYTLKNAPEAFLAQTKFVTFTPASIQLLGPPDSVQKYAELIKNQTFDFDHLQLTRTLSIPLTVPSGVTVVDKTTEVKATFAINGFSSKKMNMTLAKGQNVTILNEPAGKTVTLSQQTLSNIQFFGTSSGIKALKASDLSIEIDMKGTATDGPNLYTVRIKIANRDDVWVYYGDANETGIGLYLTVK